MSLKEKVKLKFYDERNDCCERMLEGILEDVDLAVTELKKKGRNNFKKYLKTKTNLSECEYFLLLDESDVNEIFGEVKK